MRLICDWALATNRSNFMRQLDRDSPQATLAAQELRAEDHRGTNRAILLPLEIAVGVQGPEALGGDRGLQALTNRRNGRAGPRRWWRPRGRMVRETREAGEAYLLAVLAAEEFPSAAVRPGSPAGVPQRVHLGLFARDLCAAPPGFLPGVLRVLGLVALDRGVKRTATFQRQPKPSSRSSRGWDPFARVQQLPPLP